MTVRVETDITAAETGSPSKPGLFQFPAWLFILVLVFVFLAGLMLLNGPDLLVSYANRFDGGTWSIPRPGIALSILSAELNLRRYMDGLDGDLEGVVWSVKSPAVLEPALEYTTRLMPGVGFINSANDTQAMLTFKPSPLVFLVDVLQVVIPETDRIKAAVDLEVWEFLYPDITSELLIAGLWFRPNSPELHDALGLIAPRRGNEAHVRPRLPGQAQEVVHDRWSGPRTGTQAAECHDVARAPALAHGHTTEGAVADAPGAPVIPRCAAAGAAPAAPRRAAAPPPPARAPRSTGADPADRGVAAHPAGSSRP